MLLVIIAHTKSLLAIGQVAIDGSHFSRVRRRKELVSHIVPKRLTAENPYIRE
jgi:hypothetical protein